MELTSPTFSMTGKVYISVENAVSYGRSIVLIKVKSTSYKYMEKSFGLYNLVPTSSGDFYIESAVNKKTIVFIAFPY